MPTHLRTHPDIADIVALAKALDREEPRATGDVRARERRIAQALPGGREDTVAVALAWLNDVETEDETVRSIHHRAETALHLTSVFIAIAGILLGWGATLAAFYFDGSGRVNAVSVLAILVALPALLIVPYLIAALPHQTTRRIPGAGVVSALGRALSPGRLAPLFWRAFPRDLRDALALLSGRMGRHRQLYSSLQKWAILRWSQLFAVAFQLTAVVACLILVVFTDLAFGWSTTLTTGNAALDAQRVHRITSLIAAPWGWALPEARPSLELIEESRYYRVAAESVSRAQAARLGGWWKFVVLSIVVYGLLPRVITFAIARSRLRAAARAAVIAGPGLSAVLRRIHRAQIETRAVEPESVEDPGAEPEPTERAGGASHQVLQRASGNVRAVINWSGVPVDAGAFAAAFPGVPIFEAGGAATVEEDVALAGRLGDAPGASGDVIIVVKAWEPPLMEFLDFLKTLRGALAGEPVMIVVLPVGLDRSAELGAASPGQVKLWRDRLAATGDPWLRVAAAREEVHA